MKRGRQEYVDQEKEEEEEGVGDGKENEDKIRVALRKEAIIQGRKIPLKMCHKFLR